MSIVQLVELWRGVGQVTRNAVVVVPGRLDRSATGTGLSARMAVLHARGLVGDAMTHASVLGTTFDGRRVAETSVGDRPAIVPAIRGSAWITSVSRLPVEPTDPFPEGYLLPDTWASAGSTPSDEPPEKAGGRIVRHPAFRSQKPAGRPTSGFE